jgi:L-2-hydroxyglutarate oxidase LhgO
MTIRSYDYVVIGGGISGLSVGRELALRHAGSVVVLEQGSTYGLHQSGRNSGVIHSGIQETPGTIKAELCLRGNVSTFSYCVQHKVPVLACGTLIIARTPDEIPSIDALLRKAQTVGVPHLKLVDESDIRHIEPNARCIKGILAQTGAVMDIRAYLQALFTEATSYGVDFDFGQQVHAITGNIVRTNKEDFEAGHIINCAGLQADRIAQMMGAGTGLKVIPFRGDYYSVDGLSLNTMVYPIPDDRFPFKGVHVIRSVDDTVLAGPTATLAWGREAYDREWNSKDAFDTLCSPHFLGLAFQKGFLRLAAHYQRISSSPAHFVQEVKKLVPSIQEDQLRPHRSGIRAQMVDAHGRFVKDLCIEHYVHSTHVLNAVSPQMTNALVLAPFIVDVILEERSVKDITAYLLSTTGQRTLYAH